MKKNNGKKTKNNLILFIIFIGGIGLSFLLDYSPGKNIGHNFWIFARDMIKILPPAFVLIGLFDVWVERETIEKNFGKASGFKKYIFYTTGCYKRRWNICGLSGSKCYLS